MTGDEQPAGGTPASAGGTFTIATGCPDFRGGTHPFGRGHAVICGGAAGRAKGDLKRSAGGEKGDTGLYGRITFQMMEDYWPTAADQPGASKHDKEHSKWYSKIHKVVLSNTLNASGLTNTTIFSENLAERIRELKQSGPALGGSEEILLFGSPTATHSLMQLDLIDGYWLFVNPVVLGQGIPLFAAIKDKIKLKRGSIRPFACGVTELNYMVERP